jgi:DNA-binding transcriptional regulator of glucitol operon
MAGIFDGWGNGLMLALVLGFAVVWALQMWLAGRQAQRFMRSVGDLRRAHGDTAIGRGGSRWRGHVFVALAADEQDRVTGALLFKGMTAFASPSPWDVPVGADLVTVAQWEGAPQRAAAAQAARFLLEIEDPDSAAGTTSLSDLPDTTERSAPAEPDDTPPATARRGHLPPGRSRRPTRTT